MYFGVDALEGDAIARNITMHWYSFGNRAAIPVHGRLKDILECVASGDHGIVLDYDQEGHLYVPHLKKDGILDVEAWGVRHLREGIHGFVDSLLTQKQFDAATWDVDGFRKTIDGMADPLINRTTKMEAEVIGRYPFKRDPVESFVEEYAPRFNLRQAFEHVIHEERRLSSWMRATYIRNSLTVRVLLKICRYAGVQWMIRWVRPFVRFGKRNPTVTLCLGCAKCPEYMFQYLGGV
jgi:hypothetical protein